jgi:lantibiotic biosynthesis protein
MTWSPIVERARISPVLTDIVAAIDRHPRDYHSELVDYVVLRSYLDSDGAVPDSDDSSGEALSTALDTLADEGGSAALYGGAARVGWAVAHHADGADADAACEAIDNVLLRQLDGWTRDYDLISGLVGFGVYAVERGEAGAPIARAVVTGLEMYMARDWITAPDLLPAHQRVLAPDGYVNLGLAHGIPGVVAVLAQFIQRGFEVARSRAVLDSALRRLLDGSPRRARGRFASWQPVEHEPSTRLAWCYGDLGVAAALLGAGLALGHDEARTEGLAVALDCAGRTVKEAFITDAGICHGAAGIAHLFNRMAQATGEPSLREAAVTWIDHMLAMRSGEPLAGFPANVPEEDGIRRMVPDASLLTGAAGVALVLHAASSETEPSWDRLLLVDMPPT